MRFSTALMPQHQHADLLAHLEGRFASVEEYLVARCHGTAPEPEPGTLAAQAEAALLQQVAPPVLPGTAVHEELRDNVRILPIGCAGLDRVLGNGVFEACVTEFAGESASGKTQLCHVLAARTAARSEGVLWLDTTNSFDARRLRQVLAQPCQEVHPPTEPDAQCAYVSLVRLHTVHQLLATLDELECQLSNTHLPSPHTQAATGPGGGASGSAPSDPSKRARVGHPPALLFHERPRMLVVDSVSAVIAPVLGHPQHAHGYLLLTQVARALKSLAARHRLAVVVTNHVTAARGGGDSGGGAGGGRDGGAQPAGAAGPPLQQPALGEAWRHQPHVRVMLQVVGEQADGLRQATTTHSAQAAAGTLRCAFRITEKGVVDEPGSVGASGGAWASG